MTKKPNLAQADAFAGELRDAADRLLEAADEVNISFQAEACTVRCVSIIARRGDHGIGACCELPPRIVEAEVAAESTVRAILIHLHPESWA